MRDLRLRIIGLAAAVATLAIAAALTVPSLGGTIGSGRAAASVTATERLAAGPYQLAITRTAEAGGERAEVRLTDGNGAPVTGKPLTGLLVYEGTAPGHEHHDILVSQETAPGRYLLDLREAVPGPWLLTLVIGDEARAAYLFAVP